MNRNVVAVIVTFNSEWHIVSCLKSLRQTVRPIVVDNASNDNTCALIEQEFPGTSILRNSENRGFAAAVNQGVLASDEPFVLLLNPDTILASPVDDLVTQCLVPGVGGAAGQLVDLEGHPQLGFNVRGFPTATTLAFETLGWNRLWSSNPVNRRYRLKNFEISKEQDVEQPAGAFLMLRRDALEAVGGFDEQFYPLWFEDVDLCRRLHDAGYRIRYVPSCVAEHTGAHSLKSINLELQRLAWYGNLLRFSGRHFSSWARLWLLLAVLTGVLGRWIWSLAAGKNNERVAYAKVLRILFEKKPRSRAAGNVD